MKFGELYIPAERKEKQPIDLIVGEVGYSEMTSQNISLYKLDEDGNPDIRNSY